MQVIIEQLDHAALELALELRAYCLGRKCNECIFIGKSGCMFRQGNIPCGWELEQAHDLLAKGGRQ